jgi:hypothetical protein
MPETAVGSLMPAGARRREGDRPRSRHEESRRPCRPAEEFDHAVHHITCAPAHARSPRHPRGGPGVAALAAGAPAGANANDNEKGHPTIVFTVDVAEGHAAYRAARDLFPARHDDRFEPLMHALGYVPDPETLEARGVSTQVWTCHVQAGTRRG